MSMHWIEAAILGAIQGLTEFLPVSSSGHLVLGKELWTTLPATNKVFDVYLHGVTLLVVLIVFRKRIVDLVKDKPMVVALALSAVPAVVLVKYCGFKDAFENADVNFVLATEVVTGLVLLLGESVAQRKESESSWPLWQAALFIGFAQGLAILPGLSRSGLTIAAALMLGWKRDKAFDFAFLMSIPVIGGAMLLKGLEIYKGVPPVVGTPVISTGALLAGAVTAGLLGYLTLIGLRSWVQRGLRPFAYYCIALGIGGWLWKMI